MTGLQDETDAEIAKTQAIIDSLEPYHCYLERLFYAPLLDGFKLNVVMQQVTSYRPNSELSLDLLGYTEHMALAVCIASLCDEASLLDTLAKLAQFPAAFPDHTNKKLYGLVAAVDIADNMRERVLKHGLYLARINDDTFKLTVPRGFKPKNYGKQNLGLS